MFQTKSRNINKHSELNSNGVMNSENSVSKNNAIFSYKENLNQKSRNIDKIMVDKNSSKTQANETVENKENKTVMEKSTKRITTAKHSGLKEKLDKLEKSTVQPNDTTSKFNKPSIKILSEKSKEINNIYIKNL